MCKEKFQWINQLTGHATKVANCIQHPFLLFVRLYWGWGFVQAGWGKFGHIGEVGGYFGSLGIPFPQANACLAASSEVFFGALLLLGLFSRLATLPLIIVLCVAYSTAHMSELTQLFSDPSQFFEAAPYLFLQASLTVLIFGPGKWSLDAWWWEK